MPIKIPKDLPATKTLQEENIFVIDFDRVISQDIRSLSILILNLMPTKIDTEIQIVRLLGNSPLQIEVELLAIKDHIPKNIPYEYMLTFYKFFEDIKENYYDGLIITGAPVEQLPFEEVEYWDELCEIMEWSKSHVHSTFHICWGAQAGLYYHYGINKVKLPEKLFGIFSHRITHKDSILFRGFDDEFYAPHSRYTTVLRSDIEKIAKLKILAESDDAGVYAISTDDGSQIFITGHSEYDADTLNKEYCRDKENGVPINKPDNYFPDDDDSNAPICKWRSGANLLFSNWMNYFVYQSTPYHIDEIQNKF